MLPGTNKAHEGQASRPGYARAAVLPTLAFMKPRLSRWIALGAGSGLSPVSPGTVGTLWAWVTFLLLNPVIGAAGWALVLPLAFVLGVWACERTGRDLGVSDHGAMVWDEVVAFWLVLWIVPDSAASQWSAFLLFRFFDIVKPVPIRTLERAIKGGFGVMLDDLLAAGYTLLVIAVWARLFP
ncbi:MAG: Phosphatidylglycerophosphatase [Pseudomonadota bacterium]